VRWAVLALALLWLSGCGAAYALRHRVGPGEDLGSIARAHGVTEQELRAFNRLEPGDRVAVGDVLFLPGGGRPALAAEPSGSAAVPPARAVAPAPAPRVSPVTSPASAQPLRQPEPPRASPGPRTPAAPGPSGQGRLRWPAEGPVLRGFGTGPAGESRGVDIGVPPGTAVGAADRGTVTYAGTPASAYGPLVILEHEGGLFTVYGNLVEYRVEKGQRVEPGQGVGTSGSRDPTLPPHVHFEVRRGQTPEDPLLFLPPR